MTLKHIQLFDSYVNENENKDSNEELKAPELDGSVKTLKKAGQYQSKKGKEIYGVLKLSHDNKNVLGKESMNTKFTYDDRTDKYKSEVKINHPKYSGKVVVYVDWDFGDQKLEYGMPQIDKNIQWVVFEPKQSDEKIVSKSSDKKSTIVVKKFDLDAANFFDLDKSELK